MLQIKCYKNSNIKLAKNNLTYNKTFLKKSQTINVKQNFCAIKTRQFF